MKILFHAWVVATFSIVPFAVGQDEEVGELDLLFDQYRETIAEKVEATFEHEKAALDENYLAALKRSLGAVQNAGKLEDAVAIRKEIQQTENGEDLDLEIESAVLRTLRGVYDKSVAKLETQRQTAIAPLKQNLMASMRSLMAKLTKDGRFDDGLAVKQRLEDMINGKFDPLTPDAPVVAEAEKPSEPAGETMTEADPGGLQAWLQTREFFWRGQSADEVVIRFNGNQASVIADGREIMKRDFKVISKDEFQFEWSPGDPNTFEISPDRSSFIRTIRPGSNGSGQIRQRTDANGQLLSWLQEHELYWGSSVPFVIRFDGEEARRFANGELDRQNRFTVLSSNQVRIAWHPDNVHTFTIAEDKQSFEVVYSGNGGGRTNSGKVRKRD